MRYRLCIGIVLWSLAAIASGQIYKWVDEKGVTHYGEKPPQGSQAQQVGAKLATPTSSPPQKQDSDYWQSKELELRKRNIARDQKAAYEEQQSQAKTQNCNAARDNLRQLESSSRVYDLDSKGERVFRDDSGRNAAIEKTRKQVAGYCQ